MRARTSSSGGLPAAASAGIRHPGSVSPGTLPTSHAPYRTYAQSPPSAVSPIFAGGYPPYDFSSQHRYLQTPSPHTTQAAAPRLLSPDAHAYSAQPDRKRRRTHEEQEVADEQHRRAHAKMERKRREATNDIVDQFKQVVPSLKRLEARDKKRLHKLDVYKEVLKYILEKEGLPPPRDLDLGDSKDARSSCEPPVTPSTPVLALPPQAPRRDTCPSTTADELGKLPAGDSRRASVNADESHQRALPLALPPRTGSSPDAAEPASPSKSSIEFLTD
ncbi:hypothetical protein IWW54_005619 [Coemansia sp. RSA 2705]|nr:hypothetical protein IWW54_005619 [Coemansia sp. RSA 2705]